MDKEVTYDLVEFSKESIDYSIVSSEEFSKKYLDLVNTLKSLTDIRKEIDEKLKEVLAEAYFLTGDQTIETDLCKITYVPEGMRESFNTTKFKKDHPDLYREYLEVSKTSPSIRTTPKKKGE